MYFYQHIRIYFFMSVLLICFKTVSVCNADSLFIEYPLVNAIINKDIAKVKELVSEGVDVNKRDNCGKTAIMYAYSRFSNWSTSKDSFLMDVIEILLKAGSSNIVSIDDNHIVQAELIDVNFANRYNIHPVAFKYCSLGVVDRCPENVLKEVNDIISKGCF